jgi:hypothetical protein
MPQRKIKLVPHGVATVPISELASTLSNWRTQTGFPGPKDWVFASSAAPGNWPDAYRVNRYVQGENADADDVQALSGFRRFPAWMWRNADILDFVGWLRTHNDSVEPERRVGFYGLDLHSMHASIEAVLTSFRLAGDWPSKEQGQLRNRRWTSPEISME